MAPPDEARSNGPLLDVHPLATDLGERFRAAGFQLALVGGSVRDLILGRSSPDLDFATDAQPEQTLRVIQGWADRRFLQGVRFGTVGGSKDGHLIEITTYRMEAYPEDERKPAVTFGTDLEEDLSRRDFTVNAMAVRLPEREFADPFGGVRHLATRVLDTPLDPEVSFGDDPLRMLRAARFVAWLGLTPAHRVVRAMGSMAGRLEIVSAERIGAELARLLEAPDPTGGLELIVATGLAEHFLPELPALKLEQDPVHHHKDVLKHTIAVVARCQPPLLTLRLAALLHDIGKPATRTFGVDGVAFHHHEVVGARMAEERLKALRYPNDVVRDVCDLIRLHLRFHTYGDGWTDSALRRYIHDAGPLLDDLNALVRADCTTRNAQKAKALGALQDDLELQIARLTAQENIKELRPPLDGNEVMEHLGVPPGPLIGEALAYLKELRLERGPIDRVDALRMLDEWAAERGNEPWE